MAFRHLYTHGHQLGDSPKAEIDRLIAACAGKVDAVSTEQLSWRGHWGQSGLYRMAAARPGGLTLIDYMATAAAEAGMQFYLQFTVGWIDNPAKLALSEQARVSMSPSGTWNMASYGYPNDPWFALFMPSAAGFILDSLEEILTNHSRYLEAWAGVILDGIRYKWAHRDYEEISLEDTTHIVRSARAMLPDSLELIVASSHDEKANVAQHRRPQLWQDAGYIQGVHLMGYLDPVADKHAWAQSFTDPAAVIPGIMTETTTAEFVAADIAQWQALNYERLFYFCFPKVSEDQFGVMPGLPGLPGLPDPDGPLSFSVDLHITGTVTLD